MDTEMVDIDVMELDQANLTNLTQLWQKYGAQALPTQQKTKWQANLSWPHRCWLARPLAELGDQEFESQLLSGLTRVPNNAILSLWPSALKQGVDDAVLRVEQVVTKHHWLPSFEQVAMYKTIDPNVDYQVSARDGFRLVEVSSELELQLWLDVASAAFDYQIDSAVIAGLLNDPNIKVLLAYQGKQAVASALLYKTGEVIGLHQVGVKPACQGQGLARDLMHTLIAMSAKWQGRYVVLQASAAGLPLYQRLGFVSQFKISNYRLA
ncbi:GNAT family N-acetyltransferase [Motilimonas sp. KMU-193]|uniref:GNAT family N-acetyltransferase n=1 Tax=Motilimonas sp. KMU-193 TaxID=3388668 RepID=UPI00396AF0EA